MTITLDLNILSHSLHTLSTSLQPQHLGLMFRGLHLGVTTYPQLLGFMPTYPGLQTATIF